MSLSPKQRRQLIGSLRIYNRNTKKISFFSMNDAQSELLDLLETYNRVLVLKARRFGISTLIRSWTNQFFLPCFSLQILSPALR